MAYIETPRTDIGNATYMTDGPNIEDVSMDDSLMSPLKKQDDLLHQLRSNRGVSLKTPRTRIPLVDRRNLPTAPTQVEFTPLLKSVTKKNQLRRDKENGLPITPAFLKSGYKANDSSALPNLETSVVYGEDTGSSIRMHNEEAVMPQISDSSAQSTPLAVLPRRNGEGATADQGNLLTLREQENIIDRIEKQNFGLKLKIHFLEETLRKAGPGYHEAALKENTELKVDKVTMKKELLRTRKTLEKAEQDVEAYRIHLEEVQEKVKLRYADQGIKEELEELRKILNAKSAEVDDLRLQLTTMENKGHDVAKLRDDVEDLQAGLREKDQMLEAKEDEIDKLNDQADQNSNYLAELEDEIDSMKRENEELESLRVTVKDLQDAVGQANRDVAQLREERKNAVEEQQAAEDEVRKLRDELANKSFNDKGWGRQLEDKANKLDHDLTDMRKNYDEIEKCLEERTLDVNRINCELRDDRLEAEIREQRLQSSAEILRHEHDIAARDRDSLKAQVQKITKDLQNKSEEKNLLESRHSALTTESQALQRELSEAQKQQKDLEKSFEEESQRSLENDRNLRTKMREQTDHLADEIDDLQRQFDDERSRYNANEEQWGRQSKDLHAQRDKLEQKVVGLQRTVDKLQESEGTLSGQERIFREALESEKERHQNEETIFDRQVQELQAEIDENRQSLDEVRSELVEVKQDLRVSMRKHSSSNEQVQALEDEIEVLQLALDEEVDRARDDVTEARKEAGELRQQVQTIKQELHQAETAKSDAEDKVEKLTKTHQSSDPSKERLDSRLQDTETQLKLVRVDKQSLHEQLDQAHEDLRTLQATIAKVESDQGEVISLRQDLLTARQKEIDHTRREARQKDCIRDLKGQITDLEQKNHEMELSKLAINSPKSSIDGSAHRTDIAEVRRQLTEAHQFIKDLRINAREAERESRRKSLAAEKEAKKTYEDYVNQKEQLEHHIADLNLQQEEQMAKNASTEQTIERLRTRIHGLETNLHAARLNQSDDRTMAEERKDLHEMLKDAKLEAEDLQVQIQNREQLMQDAFLRESNLRADIKRVREERTLQMQKAGALVTELDSLQWRYERSVEKLSRQQQAWNDERRSLVSRERFPNMSVSSIHGGDPTQARQLEIDIEEKEKKHAAELRGLAKQIQWMRARFMREEGFRYGLAYEKKYLLMHIEMYEACNKIDLRLLEQMGVRPARKPTEKRTRFRSVVIMVLASVKIQRLQQAWASQKKLRMSLVQKAEQTKRLSKKRFAQ